MAIVVLNLVVSVIGECVLAKTEDKRDTVIKAFRTSQVRNCNVDVVDPDNFRAHGVFKLFNNQRPSLGAGLERITVTAASLPAVVSPREGEPRHQGFGLRTEIHVLDHPAGVGSINQKPRVNRAPLEIDRQISDP